MNNCKAIGCYNCGWILLEMPASEIIKMNGLNFWCDCCGRANVLNHFKFLKSAAEIDPFDRTFQHGQVV